MCYYYFAVSYGLQMCVYEHLQLLPTHRCHPKCNSSLNQRDVVLAVLRSSSALHLSFDSSLSELFMFLILSGISLFMSLQKVTSVTSRRGRWTHEAQTATGERGLGRLIYLCELKNQKIQ